MKVHMFAIALGAVGLLIPMPILFGNSQPMVHIGIMISGAIILGSGIIAMAIAQNGK